jgi:hypothetical protein
LREGEGCEAQGEALADRPTRTGVPVGVLVSPIEVVPVKTFDGMMLFLDPEILRDYGAIGTSLHPYKRPFLRLAENAWIACTSDMDERNTIVIPTSAKFGHASWTNGKETFVCLDRVWITNPEAIYRAAVGDLSKPEKRNGVDSTWLRDQGIEIPQVPARPQGLDQRRVVVAPVIEHVPATSRGGATQLGIDALNEHLGNRAFDYLGEYDSLDAHFEKAIADLPPRVKRAVDPAEVARGILVVPLDGRVALFDAEV